jgi:uncharacterized protein (DUF2267 family)
MSTTIEGLAHTVQVAHEWINDLDERLSWHHKPRAFRLLKSVLHALRDRLPLIEASDLGAQLPTLIRGIYYEQWRPAEAATRLGDKAAFLKRIHDDFSRDPELPSESDVMAVFGLLSKKISSGEIDQVRRLLPPDLRSLWPEPYTAPGQHLR